MILITHDLGVVAGSADRVRRHVRGAGRRVGADATTLFARPRIRTRAACCGSIPRLAGHEARAARADPRPAARPRCELAERLRVRDRGVPRASDAAVRSDPAARIAGRRPSVRGHRCHSMTETPLSPPIECDQLTKTSRCAGRPRPSGASVSAVDGVELRRRAARDARAGGRERLRQVDDWAAASCSCSSRRRASCGSRATT